MGDIWLEKYRPYTLEDVEGNVEAVDRLKNIAREGNMPHLLIAVGYDNVREESFQIVLLRAWCSGSSGYWKDNERSCSCSHSPR